MKLPDGRLTSRKAADRDVPSKPHPDILPFMSRWKAFVGRVALCGCGLFSILVGRTYESLHLFYPSDQRVWTIFYIVLIVLGVISLGAGLLPDSWMRKMLGWGSGEGSPLRLSVKLLVVFAAISYGTVALLAVVHPSTRISPLTTYSLCPSCVLTLTVDPSLTSSLLVLAPLSAAAYGALGAAIGLVFGIRHQ
ncbi:MAG TPA: hypothetical protein VHX60_15935 [Acidobacteriaceae bacterium]|jgi:hypothetical protein|nr:hypothetical protein [Acidobacteriaceae bacterium]